MRTIAPAILLFSLLATAPLLASGTVSIVAEPDLAAPVEHSLAELTRALADSGFAVTRAQSATSGSDYYIHAELSSDGSVPEALTIRRAETHGKPS